MQKCHGPALVLGSLFVLGLQGATLPTGFTETLIASGLSSPTAMAFAPDGRLFVCQQGGQLRVIKNGSLLPTPFLTINVNSVGERGLLGVAFDPNFASNSYVYVYYTVPSPLHNRVSRFMASGDVSVSGSETVIFDLNPLSSATNHNGGALHFGPDGKLYIGVGENANASNAQTLTNLLGKMLRINADGSIPSDNPFNSQATGLNRAIWSMGLRNPFTFAFQPGTGRMFINDVGQNTFEEINDGVAGSNYGWPTTEGTTTDPRFRSPLFAYGHGSGDTNGCAITGGTFYNPATQQFPAAYAGQYFFADFCNNWIRKLNPANNSVTGFATGISGPTDLQVGNDGRLYYLARGAGAIYGIQYAASQPPQITVHPANKSVALGQPATFSVSATGSLPLTYTWQRNGVPIGGAASASYTLGSTSASDNGAQFRVVVSNSFGMATSNPATLTVTGNTPPVPNIASPAAGTLYTAGSTINYSGSGSDAENGNLPASAMTWQVDFHHADHVHPFLAARSGSASGSFTIPTTGETATNVWYRIYLTVRDSAGAATTVFRDIQPRVATIQLQSNPGGLKLTLDGQPVTAPYSTQSVVGTQRAVGVVSPQSSGASAYTFAAWSDGQPQTHTIATPAVSTTYTASFNITAGPLFQLNLSTAEISAITDGTIVAPFIGPAGSVVVRGTGSAAFVPVVNSNGMAFAKPGQQNANTAFLSFAGAQLSNLFNVNQGDITFYVRSSYSLAERQAQPAYNYRWVFDVYDGTKRLFQFYTYAAGGRLIFFYSTGSTATTYYYVPIGQENQIFGKGVTAKFRLTWNGTTNTLYVNDQVARAGASYTKATPSWNSAASFTIGGTSTGFYGGGYFASDDAIAEIVLH